MLVWKSCRVCSMPRVWFLHLYLASGCAADAGVSGSLSVAVASGLPGTFSRPGFCERGVKHPFGNESCLWRIRAVTSIFKAVTSSLRQKGVRSRPSCSSCLHFSLMRQPKYNKHRLWKFWNIFHPVAFGLLVPSRRLHAWCSGITCLARTDLCWLMLCSGDLKSRTEAIKSLSCNISCEITGMNYYSACLKQDCI